LDFDLRKFFFEVTVMKFESDVRLVVKEGMILFGAGDLPARESPPEDDDIFM
jgi:hypothetical protein